MILFSDKPDEEMAEEEDEVEESGGKTWRCLGRRPGFCFSVFKSGILRNIFSRLFVQ
jgi:hypothetical protein